MTPLSINNLPEAFACEEEPRWGSGAQDFMSCELDPFWGGTTVANLSTALIPPDQVLAIVQDHQCPKSYRC